MILSPLNIAVAALILNIWTFMAFGWDKIRAEKGGWRVAESTLLSFALCGGIFGAYAGRTFFRHKTRKQPFSTLLFGIALLQCCAAFFAGCYYLGLFDFIQ